MIIVGLNFGHDASICITENGKIIYTLQFERRLQVKRIGGLISGYLFEILRGLGIGANDIDAFSLTSTQRREFVIDNPAIFDIELTEESEKKLKLYENDHYIHDNYFTDPDMKYQHRFFSESHRSIPYPSITTSLPEDPDFHIIPVNVRYLGTIIPSYIVGHHLAHCGSAYYKSGYDKSMIFTSDGGFRDSGFIAMGEGNKIRNLKRHNLIGGICYDEMSRHIGLTYGGAGKLMGLSAYCDQTFENLTYMDNFNNKGSASFFKNINTELETRGIHKDDYINADVFNEYSKLCAGYTQQSFEHTIYKTVTESFNTSEMDTLCMAGGGSLNCPTNAKIANFIGEKNLYIDNACNDEGISFGSAAVIYHHVHDYKQDSATVISNQSPYHGENPRNVSNALNLLNQSDCSIQLNSSDNLAKKAATLLTEDKVGAIMRGNAELGPRALGNRSIISAAHKRKYHQICNSIKNREQWRPLAPAVREQDFSDYFSGVKNGYMLMTNEVKSGNLPAIEHVDHSARVQVVQEGTNFDAILKYIPDNVPKVIINTSFNDKDVPIYDDAYSAAKFFLNSALDFMILENHIIRKNKGFDEP